MDHFRHASGELWCEGVPLAEIAREVGTPTYVYSLGTIRTHVQRLREAFADLDPLICYAVKANPNLAVLQALHEMGVGFDIVSGGELDRLQRIGAPGQRIVYSGVGKTVAEMEAAIAHGIHCFNVESEEELDVLAGVAAVQGATVDVALRINPDVDPETHRYITTGKRESKFGVDLERGAALARRAVAHDALRLIGLQCHIGSQITTVEPYGHAVERTLALMRRLQPEAPHLKQIDMGGGYGIYYDHADVPPLTAYADVVRPLLKGTGFRLVIEPGRVIVGNAGVLLTRVLFQKASGARRFVIVDAGMNDLLRPSLYGGFHRIWPTTGMSPPPLGETPDLPLADIVGPVCESGDFLAQDRPFPQVARGDLISVMSVGAYAQAMSSNYNGRRRAAEVVVDGDCFGVARTRETYEDLVRGEVAAPKLRASMVRPARKSPR